MLFRSRFVQFSVQCRMQKIKNQQGIVVVRWSEARKLYLLDTSQSNHSSAASYIPSLVVNHLLSVEVN